MADSDTINFTQFTEITKSTPSTMLVGYQDDEEIKINSTNLIGYSIGNDGKIENLDVNNLNTSNISSKNLSSENISSDNLNTSNLSSENLSSDNISVGVISSSSNSVDSSCGEGSIVMGVNNTLSSAHDMPQYAFGIGNKVNSDMTTFTSGMYCKTEATHAASNFGYATYCKGNFQFVEGKWNIPRGEAGDNDYIAHIIGGGKGGYSKWANVNDFITEFQNVYGYNPFSEIEDGTHRYPIWFGTKNGFDTNESTFAGYVDWNAAMYLYKVIPYHTSESTLADVTVRININETNWFGDQHNVGYITSKNITKPRINLHLNWIRDNAFYVITGESGVAEQVFDADCGYTIIEGLRRFAGRWISITTNNFKGGIRDNTYFAWLSDNATVDTFPNDWVFDDLTPDTSTYNFTTFRVFITGQFDKLYISNNFSKFSNPDVYIEDELGSENNLFYHKKVTVFGDSITARGKGIGLQWQDYLSRAGATIVNQFAGSGWTLALQRGDYNCIAKMLYENTNNVSDSLDKSDIIIICAGVNDFLSGGTINYGRSLGIMNPNLKSYNGSITFGTQTFYQGLEYINWYFATNYPTKRVIFITPFDTSSSATNWVQSLQQFRDAIGNVAAYYGHDVIDVSSVGGINPVIPVINNYYYCWYDSDNNEHIDGLHPGYYGHKVLGDALLYRASKGIFNNPTTEEPSIGRYYYQSGQRRGISFGDYITNSPSGLYSITTGNGCNALGEKQLVGGRSSWAYGHAEAALSYGGDTQVKGQYGVALGAFTRANGRYQMACGAYNVEDNEEQNNETPGSKAKWVFVCGNGTSASNRSNAFAARWDGTLEVAKAIQMPIQGTDEFGYMVLAKDENNNLVTKILTEEEYNA